MSLNKQELFDKLAASIVDMDEDLTIELSNKVIAEAWMRMKRLLMA